MSDEDDDNMIDEREDDDQGMDPEGGNDDGEYDDNAGHGQYDEDEEADGDFKAAADEEEEEEDFAPKSKKKAAAEKPKKKKKKQKDDDDDDDDDEDGGSSKKKKRKSTKKKVDDEEEDDEENNNAGDEEEEDDDADFAPSKSKKKKKEAAAAKKKAAAASKKKKNAEEGGEEGAKPKKKRKEADSSGSSKPKKPRKESASKEKGGKKAAAKKKNSKEEKTKKKADAAGGEGGGEDDEEEDEIDDEDEDEDDEDAYERKQRKINKYLDREAERGEEEEEDDDDDEAKRFRKEVAEIAHIPQKERRGPAFMEYENETDVMNHFKSYSGYRNDDDDVDVTTVSTADFLQPSVKDPKLWHITCKIGKEQELVYRILHKCAEYQKQEKEVSIISAFTNGHSKGCIYVEAYRQVHVQEMLAGMRDIFFQKGQHLVPLEEMAGCLAIARPKTALTHNQWVRAKGNISKGLYKGDVAQVVDIDEARDIITIRLLPRFDFQKLLDAARSEGGGNPNSHASQYIGRPPGCLFDFDKVPDMIKDQFISRGDDSFQYQGDNIVSGYLLKEVRTRAVDANVQPTLEEIRRFNPTALEQFVDGQTGATEAEEDEYDFKLARPPVQYIKGDLVRVKKGELAGLLAEVDSVDKDIIRIRPKHSELSGVFEFGRDEICKHFPQGTNVKVMFGRHKNKIGIVTRVEGEVITILTHVQNKELRVLASDLQRSTETSEGIEVLGNFRLLDLVQLDNSSGSGGAGSSSASAGSAASKPADVGVIVKIEGGMFEILDNTGQIQKIMPYNIKRKINSSATLALDSHSNQLANDHMIRVVDGIYKGKTGCIKHIYRSFLFIHTPTRIENAGVFVVRPRQCVRMGSDKPTQAKTGMMSSPMMSVAPSRRELHPWVGKTARITKGPYKGHRCIVKEAQEFMANVELTINCKRISVKLAMLKECDKNGEEVFGSALNLNEPFHNPNTPSSWNARTPMEAPMTPMHDPDGSRTPIRGDDAWNPLTPATPMTRDDMGSNMEMAAPTPQQSYDPHPITPGSMAFTHATPAEPHTPFTPGAHYTPMYTSSMAAPTPHGHTPRLDPITPETGTPLQPVTPGSAPMSSFNPESAYQPQQSAGEMWALAGVEVQLFNGETGIVLEPLGDSHVRLQLGQQEQTLAQRTMQPVQPSKQDAVIILSGPLRGMTGKLIGIDGGDGIVKMDDNVDIKILDMMKLARFRKI